MKFAPILATALAVGTLSPAADAAFVFQDLLNGGTITAGDKTFSEFNVEFQSQTGARLPNPSNISVDALTDGGMSPGPGLFFDFGGELSVAGTAGNSGFSSIDYQISFLVKAAGPFAITNALLDMDSSFVGTFAGTFIQEWVFAPDADISDTDNALLTFDVTLDDIVDAPSNTASFGPLSSVRIVKNHFVTTLFEGETAQISTVTQRYAQVEVPVPMTSGLLLLGLTGLVAVRRRRAP